MAKRYFMIEIDLVDGDRLSPTQEAALVSEYIGGYQLYNMVFTEGRGWEATAYYKMGRKVTPLGEQPDWESSGA